MNNLVIIIMLAALAITGIFAMLMRALYFASVRKLDNLMKDAEATLLLLTSDAIAACGEVEQKRSDLRAQEERQCKPIVIDYPKLGHYQETYYVLRVPNYISIDTLHRRKP
jgi:Flp pilus assembly protein CpaB